MEIVAAPAAGEIRIDGLLDEEVWRTAEPVGAFVQAEPREGEPATEITEVRVAYDDQNLYIGAYLRESEPRRLVVAEIRKDYREETQDGFEVILDTFGDRRNGYVFATNPEGARSDRQVANEGREINVSWDAVWSVRTRRAADGWTVEMSIPFRALRFNEGGDRVWGINFSRRIRRKNEIDFWSPVPRAYNLARVSLAGNLTGLPSSSSGRDLRIKPYVAGRTVRETGGSDFEAKGDVGADLKYGVTRGLTLDLTVNPDFAQAEADEQQVNLTQFSQFFPEKREFFLENSGVFYVGDAARNNRVVLTPTPDEDLLLFFSRRIGLADDGREIPIIGGARLTGNAAGFGIGALTMQTKRLDESPSNNYTVIRARRNLFSGSDAGAIFMMRQSADSSGDYNRVYGADANVRFFRRLDWNSYAIGTATPGISGGQYAARTSLNWEGNFFHGKGGVLQIGENFNDELGYYRRTNVRKWFTDIGFRPRVASLASVGIREMHPHIVWDYYENLDRQMVGKRLHTGYTVFLNNGGFGELSYNPQFQLITAPFEIHAGTPPIPAGSWGWNEYQIFGSTDPSRMLSFSLRAIAGGLWSGTQRTVNGNVTVRPSYRFRLTGGIQRTAAKLDGPDADFVASLVTLRTNYSFTTNMFVDALSQYDPDRKQLNANVRFNLIHHPLSDLFVVFNEQRFLTDEGTTPGRSVIVKFTQMMAF